MYEWCIKRAWEMTEKLQWPLTEEENLINKVYFTYLYVLHCFSLASWMFLFLLRLLLWQLCHPVGLWSRCCTVIRAPPQLLLSSFIPAPLHPSLIETTNSTCHRQKKASFRFVSQLFGTRSTETSRVDFLNFIQWVSWIYLQGLTHLHCYMVLLLKWQIDVVKA